MLLPLSRRTRAASTCATSPSRSQPITLVPRRAATSPTCTASPPPAAGFTRVAAFPTRSQLHPRPPFQVAVSHTRRCIPPLAPPLPSTAAPSTAPLDPGRRHPFSSPWRVSSRIQQGKHLLRTSPTAPACHRRTSPTAPASPARQAVGSTES